MTKRRSILLSVAVVAGGLLWYLFRPDALIISKTVNEPFPAAEGTASSMTESPGMAHSSMSQESGMSHESAMSEGSGGVCSWACAAAPNASAISAAVKGSRRS